MTPEVSRDRRASQTGEWPAPWNLFTLRRQWRQQQGWGLSKSLARELGGGHNYGSEASTPATTKHPPLEQLWDRTRCEHHVEFLWTCFLSILVGKQYCSKLKSSGPSSSVLTPEFLVSQWAVSPLRAITPKKLTVGAQWAHRSHFTAVIRSTQTLYLLNWSQVGTQRVNGMRTQKTLCPLRHKSVYVISCWGGGLSAEKLADRCEQNTHPEVGSLTLGSDDLPRAQFPHL